MSKLHEEMKKTTFFAEKVLVLSSVKGARNKWRMFKGKRVMGGMMMRWVKKEEVEKQLGEMLERM